MKNKWLFNTGMWLLLVVTFGLPAKLLGENGIFDLLDYKEVVNIDLTFDQEKVFADRRSDNEYEATLGFKDEMGKNWEWSIKLSLRGKFRRLKCSEVPPLKIKFKKSDLKEAGLAKFNDFKLVTYCVDDYQAAKELLLKEYLTYKLYNQITDYSFRVQLVNITYRDLQSGQRKKQLGFLIEDTAQLRARIGAEKSKEEHINEPERFHLDYQKTVAFFQYVIGNSDWGITYSKNIKYVIKDGLVIPIPYDFDFSAVVGAPYASYIQKLGQTSLQDRVYLGFERSSEDLARTVQLFAEKKEQLYQTIRDFKLLKASARKEMIAYLDSYFAQDEPEIKFSEIWF